MEVCESAARPIQSLFKLGLDVVETWSKTIVSFSIVQTRSGAHTVQMHPHSCPDAVFLRLQTSSVGQEADEDQRVLAADCVAFAKAPCHHVLPTHMFDDGICCVCHQPPEHYGSSSDGLLEVGLQGNFVLADLGRHILDSLLCNSVGLRLTFDGWVYDSLANILEVPQCFHPRHHKSHRRFVVRAGS